MINKCPYCNGNNFHLISDNNSNIKYALTQVDISTGTFLPGNGMPIDAYGCLDCKGIVLVNELLHKN